MHTKTIDVSGTSLYYRSVGEGPCVVLLHGFGEDGRAWRFQWNQLPGYRLLIPDLPGSGLSEQGGSSMEDWAAAVQQLLRQEGIDDCTIIGHSMGGYVALAFLEQYPELVRALGLFHSSALADSAAKKETREKGIAFMEKHGAARFLESTTPNLFAPDTQSGKPWLIQETLEQTQHAGIAPLRVYYRAMMDRPDRTQLLRTAGVPILIVLGKYDQAVPMADGLRQAHLPQMALVHLLQQSGHMGMMEEPEESNKLIRDFLALVPFT